MTGHEEIFARLDRLRSLWRALERLPGTSRHYEVLADEIHVESVTCLELIRAQREVDRKGDRRS
jgi:hypothetical protein